MGNGQSLITELACCGFQRDWEVTESSDPALKFLHSLQSSIRVFYFSQMIRPTAVYCGFFSEAQFWHLFSAVMYYRLQLPKIVLKVDEINAKRRIHATAAIENVRKRWADNSWCYLIYHLETQPANEPFLALNYRFVELYFVSASEGESRLLENVLQKTFFRFSAERHICVYANHDN